MEPERASFFFPFGHTSAAGLRRQFCPNVRPSPAPQLGQHQRTERTPRHISYSTFSRDISELQHIGFSALVVATGIEWTPRHISYSTRVGPRSHRLDARTPRTPRTHAAHFLRRGGDEVPWPM